MTDVKLPLPSTIQSFDGLAKREESVVNLFGVPGKEGEVYLVPLPALGSARDAADSSGSAVTGGGRAIFELKGEEYLATARGLYHVTGSGDPNSFALFYVGALSFNNNALAIGKVDVAVSHTHAVLVEYDGKIYSFDGTTIDDITNNSNYVASAEVTYINGRFLFTPVDGSPIIYTNSNSLVIDAVNFFDAETSPDFNTGVVNLKNDIFVLGTRTIEIFRDVGTAAGTFRRIDGATIDHGYVTAKVYYKETFFFIGRERDAGLGIFAIGSGAAVRVSTPPIDAILQTYNIQNLGSSSTRNLIKSVATKITYKGYDLLVFSLEEHTLIFHEGQWTYARSPNSAFWNVRNCLHSRSKQVVMALTRDGQAGIVGDFNHEQDNQVDFPIEREINSYVRHDNESVFTVNNVRLSVSADHNTVLQPIGISVSHNGVDYGPEMLRAPAESDQIHFTGPGGLGRYEGYMGFKIRTEGQYKFACDSATIDMNV